MTGIPEDRGRRPEDSDEPSDTELLRRYAETRAEDAFAVVVRRHVDGVYSAALRRLGGDRHLAEDVAQRVFVALARKASMVAQHDVVAAWLYTVTRNEAANAVRGEQRRKARELEAMSMHDANDEPAADWSRVAPVLDEVVDELSDADRTAILLRFVDRRPFADVGAALRVSEDAARMRVDRALEKLKVLLGRRGVTSSVAALGVVLTNHAVAAAPVGLAATVTGAAVMSTAAIGPVAALVQFMITSKTAMGVAGVVVLAALGTAVHETRARQATSDTLAVAVAESTALDARLRDTQQRAATAGQAAEAARVAATQAPAATPALVATVAPDPQAAGRKFLADHPEARALWDERERANIGTRLGPIFQVMNLSASEREQLTTIFMNSAGGTTTMGGPGGPIALRREPTLSRTEAEAQMLALLGPERGKQFMEFSTVAPTFDFTAKMASALYRTEPLTTEQTGQLMRVFANAGRAARANPNQVTTPDWNAIAAEAGTFLSPTQVAALSVVQRNLEYQQAVLKLTRAAEAQAKKAPPSR